MVAQMAEGGVVPEQQPFLGNKDGICAVGQSHCE